MTIFDKYQIQPNIRFELFDEKGIVSMVGHHLGISILPRLVLNGLLPNHVRAIPFKEETFRTIGLSTTYNISPAAEKFLEILNKWLRENEDKSLLL